MMSREIEEPTKARVPEVSAMDPKTRSLLLVNLAAVLERADEALLPAVYDQVKSHLRGSELLECS